jgi:hypothetical protein
MAENETRRAITVKLLSGGTWRSLLLAVLLLAVVRRSLELGTLANVDALGGTILTLTLLALINATFGFGLGLAAGSYLTRAKRRAPVLTWACALYGAILCVAALSSSLPVFLLLIGCATGIGVFINAGETMIETGYLDSETEIVTANALRGARCHIAVFAIDCPAYCRHVIGTGCTPYAHCHCRHHHDYPAFGLCKVTAGG